ncbi:MAG TPA: AAC(3) family N-acetyltransferase [Longimicrobiales bacterium]|nr:AAC(3) family N-acetyltransferase [Longimicrobiales bacterium]
MRVPRLLEGLKPAARRLRQSARTAYITRVHAFTPADFLAALRGVGVRTGDVLCVHSSFQQFLGFRGTLQDALRTLQESVGPDGGILMPTQPFTSTAVEYVRTHPVTDLRRAPSLMGFMTEILRRTPGVVRSINPTHPVAAWGARGTSLVGDDWEARTPCGRETAYHRMLDADARVVMLGTGLQPMTFYHCVEELLEPRLPASPFTVEEFTLQTRDAKGCLYTSRMRLFEPALSARRRMSLMVPDLQRRGAWSEARVGRLEIIAVRATDVLETCRAMADAGRFCYLP